MKEIKLTQGKVALVDDWNYDWLSQWIWHAVKGKNTYYARRSIRQSKKNNTKHRNIMMHREIMQTKINEIVDHEDHNGLNCLEENMRNCTVSQNGMNRKLNLNSKFKGVSPLQGRFMARIRHNQKLIYLGMHDTEIEAAQVYDKKAKELFGEFAYPNFK